MSGRPQEEASAAAAASSHQLLSISRDDASEECCEGSGVVRDAANYSGEYSPAPQRANAAETARMLQIENAALIDGLRALNEQVKRLEADRDRLLAEGLNLQAPPGFGVPRFVNSLNQACLQIQFSCWWLETHV